MLHAQEALRRIRRRRSRASFGQGEGDRGARRQWQKPYGMARPADFLDLASVWFNAYPASLITRPGESVVQSLADPELLRALREVGIEAIHTGPLKRAGSVRGTSYGPSIDGRFDRIELVIDPEFGSDDQYRELVKRAAEQRITIIGDLVPGHTGKGPDFRLAERVVPGYPRATSRAGSRSAPSRPSPPRRWPW
jgi:hypothetical protein